MHETVPSDPYSALVTTGTLGWLAFLVLYPLMNAKVSRALLGMFIAIPCSDVWSVLPSALHQHGPEARIEVPFYWLLALAPWAWLLLKLLRTIMPRAKSPQP